MKSFASSLSALILLAITVAAKPVARSAALNFWEVDAFTATACSVSAGPVKAFSNTINMQRGVLCTSLPSSSSFQFDLSSTCNSTVFGNDNCIPDGSEQLVVGPVNDFDADFCRVPTVVPPATTFNSINVVCVPPS